MKEIAELKKNEVPKIHFPQTMPTDGALEISGLKILGVVDLRVVSES